MYFERFSKVNDSRLGFRIDFSFEKERSTSTDVKGANFWKLRTACDCVIELNNLKSGFLSSDFSSLADSSPFNKLRTFVTMSIWRSDDRVGSCSSVIACVRCSLIP